MQTLSEFIVDTSRSRFAIAMKRLVLVAVQAQRAAKSFLECESRITVCFEFGSSASVKIVQSSLNYKRNKIIKGKWQQFRKHRRREEGLKIEGNSIYKRHCRDKVEKTLRDPNGVD